MKGTSLALCITAIVVAIIGTIIGIVLIVISFETIESTEVGLDYDTTTITMDET